MRYKARFTSSLLGPERPKNLRCRRQQSQRFRNFGFPSTELHSSSLASPSAHFTQFPFQNCTFPSTQRHAPRCRALRRTSHSFRSRTALFPPRSGTLLAGEPFGALYAISLQNCTFPSTQRHSCPLSSLSAHFTQFPLQNCTFPSTQRHSCSLSSSSAHFTLSGVDTAMQSV
jgi:hypothetical protein